MKIHKYLKNTSDEKQVFKYKCFMTFLNFSLATNTSKDIQDGGKQNLEMAESVGDKK